VSPLNNLANCGLQAKNTFILRWGVAARQNFYFSLEGGERGKGAKKEIAKK
jgi:hypothetical protein